MNKYLKISVTVLVIMAAVFTAIKYSKTLEPNSLAKSSSPLSADPVKNEALENKVQRILRRSNEIASIARESQTEVEVSEGYLAQLKAAVGEEKRSYDRVSESTKKSAERLSGLKARLNEQIMKNESPVLISSIKEEFEAEARKLIVEQQQLNEAYKSLQTAQDQAVKNIIAQLK